LKTNIVELVGMYNMILPVLVIHGMHILNLVANNALVVEW
jgi:hypothetical protein